MKTPQNNIRTSLYPYKNIHTYYSLKPYNHGWLKWQAEKHTTPICQHVVTKWNRGSVGQHVYTTLLPWISFLFSIFLRVGNKHISELHKFNMSPLNNFSSSPQFLHPAQLGPMSSPLSLMDSVMTFSAPQQTPLVLRPSPQLPPRPQMPLHSLLKWR